MTPPGLCEVQGVMRQQLGIAALHDLYALLQPASRSHVPTFRPAHIRFRLSVRATSLLPSPSPPLWGDGRFIWARPWRRQLPLLCEASHLSPATQIPGHGTSRPFATLATALGFQRRPGRTQALCHRPRILARTGSRASHRITRQSLLAASPSRST